MGQRFKVFKAVSAKRGQLSRLWVSSDVRTLNPQVARVDDRLSIKGGPPLALVSEQENPSSGAIALGQSIVQSHCRLEPVEL